MQTSDYKQLKVWQKAMNLTMEIYRLVKFLPREETYALSDQLRRAVVSIPSNIAEGHGRGTDKEFIKFLWIARGSLLEVETQLIICNRLTLIKVEESKFAQSLIVEVGKMLNALITYRTNKSNPNT
ncbi:four helix bundle protein [uncultured Muribaculum sp.]|uniref:four helix bundle protein n=2 Tax=uncultured Muribaculum sp. TaxID=1918613 RepID=UPI00259A73DD|nr:four helix bundle protein [uncultured Muribaculum sp.]